MKHKKKTLAAVALGMTAILAACGDDASTNDSAKEASDKKVKNGDVITVKENSRLLPYRMNVENETTEKPKKIDKEEKELRKKINAEELEKLFGKGDFYVELVNEKINDNDEKISSVLNLYASNIKDENSKFHINLIDATKNSNNEPSTEVLTTIHFNEEGALEVVNENILTSERNATLEVTEEQKALITDTFDKSRNVADTVKAKAKAVLEEGNYIVLDEKTVSELLNIENAEVSLAESYSVLEGNVLEKTTVQIDADGTIMNVTVETYAYDVKTDKDTYERMMVNFAY